MSRSFPSRPRPSTPVRCVAGLWFIARRRGSRGVLALILATITVGAVAAPPSVGGPPVAAAAVLSSSSASAAGTGTGSSLEAAATKAGDTGRKVAMSLIGLALAVAAVVLAFRRDFKEAAGVLAVGVVAILLATPAGVNIIRDTVNSVFGAG